MSLATIAREWARIGTLGFGGPAALIALLHRLCVVRRGWLSEHEFHDGLAVVNLLPGPAAAQLAIYCAWRLRGALGGTIAGICFAAPGVFIILGLSVPFLAARPALWLQGAAAGAGAATLGAYLVLVLLACGLAEMAVHTGRRALPKLRSCGALPLAALLSAGSGGLAALAWVAFKVGALSYGGGFVIVPLMHADAVGHHHWMSEGQFLTAVALGQITPGPVIQTVAVVGYAAAGLLAARIAFAPSFLFVLPVARHFDRLRASAAIQSFLTGAGPAAIGAIGGAAVPLALGLAQPWQFAVLAAAALWIIGLRRSVVGALLMAGLIGIIVALAGVAVGA